MCNQGLSCDQGLGLPYPCLWWLCSWYKQQSKPYCPNEATQKSLWFFKSKDNVEVVLVSVSLIYKEQSIFRIT